jgi:hypothetical protein
MKGVIRGHGDKTVYMIDGCEVSKAEFDGHFPDKPIGDGTGLCGWKELHSDAAAVHPKQIKEATESASSKGVPTNFDSEGRPIFTSRTHRSRYLRAYGFFDRSAGYGDPAPNLPKAQEVDPREYDVEN